MKKLLISIALALAPLAGLAATYYVNDCGTGAAAGCVAGDNARSAATAQDPSTPWKDISTANTNLTGGPHTIRFCRGGAWNLFRKQINTTQGATKDNRYVYEGYACTLFPNEDTGTVTSSTATTLTASAESWTTNQWAGYTVYAKAPHWENSDPHCTVKVGTIASNTATTLTVAQWDHPNKYETCATGPLVNSTFKIQGSKPRLNARNDTDTMWIFEDSGDPNVEEGFTVRGFELVGYSATGGYPFPYLGKAIHIYNLANYVTIEDNIVRNFATGFDARGSSSQAAATALGFPFGASTDAVLRGNVFTDNSTFGVLGATMRMVVENNWGDLNGWVSSPGTRNFYISSVGNFITLRGNVSTRNARNSGSTRTTSPLTVGPETVTCSSPSFLSHGTHEGVVLEDNFIYESQTGSGCQGIAYNGQSSGSYPSVSQPEDFKDLVVRGNLLVMAGSRGDIGINCSSCYRALVENNTIIQTGPDGSSNYTGILIPGVLNDTHWNGRTDSSDTPNPTPVTCPQYPGMRIIASDVRCDRPDDKPTVRNNSIWLAGTSNAVTVRGISFSDTTSIQGTRMDELSVYNNLIIFSAPGGTSPRCFNYSSLADDALLLVNRNVCYSLNGNSPSWYEGGNLATMQARSGSPDANSQFGATNAAVTTPTSGNYWRITPQAGATALIGAGHATLTPPGGARRLKRVTNDIGSEAYGGTVTLPASPTGGRSQ